MSLKTIGMIKESLTNISIEKTVLALTAVGCGAYLLNEIYIGLTQGELSSEEWRKENGYVRYPAYGNYPDLSIHNNLMAKHLTPEVYETLKRRTTSGNFTLEKVIQVGVDCPGMPWERASGVIAGDEESYVVFAPLFDKIIEDLHDYGPEDSHTRDISCKGITGGNLSKANVTSIRINAWRSLSGYRLPAACGRMERRQLEHAIRSALRRIKGEYKGDYYSISELPDGDRKHLAANMLMPLPTSPLITCSRRARDWPDARGIFFTRDKSFVVHVNEGDHLKVICMSKDSDLGATFEKFCRGVDVFEEELKRNAEEFATTEHLGYIVSDPVHLGTGMEVRVRVKFRRLSSVNSDSNLAECMESGCRMS